MTRLTGKAASPLPTVYDVGAAALSALGGHADVPGNTVSGPNQFLLSVE